jgi:hypothetical protein
MHRDILQPQMLARWEQCAVAHHIREAEKILPERVG